VFPPRGLTDGDQLADLGGSERQRYSTDDPATWTARRTSDARPAPPTSTSAAQGRLPSWTQHDPDHRHRLLLRLYHSSHYTSADEQISKTLSVHYEITYLFVNAVID